MSERRGEADRHPDTHMSSRTQGATVVPFAKGWRGSCFADKGRYMPRPPADGLLVLRVREHST